MQMASGTAMDVATDGTALKLVGDFDVRSTGLVREALYDHIDARTEGDLVVDLTAVTTIDATALRVLAVATRAAERDGHRLLLRGCNASVRRMLTLARLRHLVMVEPLAVTG